MLVKRNGIFYYRKAIPKSVRTVLGRREFLISLKTRHTSLALQKAHTVDITVRSIIHEATLGDGVLDFDLDALKAKLTKFETEEHIVEDTPDGKKSTTRSKRIDPAVINAMKDAGVPPEQIAQTVSSFIGVDKLIPDALKQSIFNPCEAVSVVTLNEYVDKYINDWEHKKGYSLDSRQKTQLRRLCEVFPADKTVGSFTESDAATARDELAKLPGYTSKYARMTVSEIVETVSLKDPNYKRVTPTTIERYFETYQALFNQAAAEGFYSHKNPFSGIAVVPGGKGAVRKEKKRRKNATKTPYSTDDLEKMFSTCLYTDFGSSTEHENVRFWLPLIGLFTGSRMSQIASLYCDDITYQDGIPIIDFNFNTDDKLGKTDVSFRPVPIHPVLVKLGIFEFADKVKSYRIPSDFGGGSRLFPELRSYNNYTYAGRIDEWFNRQYLTSLNIREVGDNKSFHAFRSTLLRLLKTAQADEHTRNQIIGWSKNDENANDVVREHYDKITLEHMQEAMFSIDLPDAFDKIPPFPVNREMKFGRRYRNQHIKK